MDLNSSLSALGADAAAYVAAVLASPRQWLAHGAVLLGIGTVLAGALVRTMMPLRWLAVGSNLGLLVFGVLHPSPTTAVIAGLLLPINLYRAVEITRLTRRVSQATAEADHAGLWLKPYMKPRKLKPGQVLFKKGDTAEHLYLLAQGRMEVAEIGRPLEAGRIFGEIALFSPDRIRTHTVRCITACTVLQIHDSTVKQLYFQNPAFGLHLVHLLAARLSGDVARIQAEHNRPPMPER